jgi:hypothetical protein
MAFVRGKPTFGKVTLGFSGFNLSLLVRLLSKSSPSTVKKQSFVYNLLSSLIREMCVHFMFLNQLADFYKTR